MAQPIYLDYNGTTPHDPEVIEAMRPYFEREFGNPSSSHWYGIIPKKAVEQARLQVASLLHCQAEEILFTSGGTESNNHALLSASRIPGKSGGHIITSQVEHPAILEVCRFLERDGYSVTYVPVDRFGLIDVHTVAAAITAKTFLVTIMHSNNEVGTLQPLEEIASLVQGKEILLHTDAAQSAGKIPLDLSQLSVDFLSLAGHKLYAPKGVGALYVRKECVLEPFCHGAGQENGGRGGTENVMSIVGLGKACEIAAQSLKESQQRLKQLRDRLHQGLSETLGATIVLHGHPEKRLPNTLSLGFKDLEANRILEEIGLDVAASAGAACHSDRVDLSHVLEAMQVPPQWGMGTIRFTLGRMTTASEIDLAIRHVVTAVTRLYREQ